MGIARKCFMSCRRALVREDGLTLVEIAAALVILSLISLYFLSYFTNSAAQSKLSNQQLSATHLANAKLHEIQSVAFDQLQQYANSGSSLPEQAEDIYSIQAVVSSSHPDYPFNPDFLYITVTVYWSKDPEHPEQYRHQLSLVGAARRDYPQNGGART
ncbi:type IV pilus modification PilV family protein [Paenibacillus sp. GM2]|uniref:type IV pilus modification PilV family protein n=1 Tax=Paenibacillus sp. GM2 TaxID=1622070 RepID=UPI0008395D76|nr:type II secretion system protein [Paenibacillus sp. GM2]